ncbi:hypothetical protein PCE1_002291 [Barthelona sp. PCE]
MFDSKIVLPGDLNENNEVFERAGLFSSSNGENRLQTRERTVNPELGHIALARVHKIELEKAICEVIAVAPSITESFAPHTSHGYIPKSFSRSHDTGRASLYQMFKPGDIVRCSIIQLETRGIRLSTNSAELGVVVAKSFEGRYMTPVDFQTMVDSENGFTEKRKVADVREYPFIAKTIN